MQAMPVNPNFWSMYLLVLHAAESWHERQHLQNQQAMQLCYYIWRCTQPAHVRYDMLRFIANQLNGDPAIA